eukprot:scaffold7414_cov116-Cylindrotheca_fusiformis.AAC.1
MEMADRGLVVIKFESSYGVRLDDYHHWRNGDDNRMTNLRTREEDRSLARSNSKLTISKL